MLTTQATAEMIREWKNIYDKYHEKLKPNRKSGAEVNDYFCRKYSHEKFDSAFFCDAVKGNIMENEHHREKLPQDIEPQIVAYKIIDAPVLVGIDLITGFFHIESEDIDRMAEIYDDLFLFRGLDKKDIQNCFLVAQYIQCSNK